MAEAPTTLNDSDAAPAGEDNPVLAAFAAAFQHVTIGMAVRAPNGQLIDANPAYSHMLGYERDELLAHGFESLTHPDDAEIDFTLWDRLVAGEMDSYQREKRYLRKDGATLWGFLTVSALRDERGVFAGGLAQVQDVTSQKIAEAALREHEAQLEALVSQLPVALYTLSPKAGVAYWYVSPRFTEQTGLRRDDLPTNFEGLLRQMHPDDREAVRKADETSERTGETGQIEYRIRGGKDEWIWVDNRSVLMRDERGRPLAWHGALLDVSERKRLEASLRDSQERFRRAFQDAAIGMSLGTPDNLCLDANPAYCRIVGRPREAVIGRSFAEFTHPDDVAAYSRQHARLYANEVGAYQIEKRYLRPDGTVVTGLLTVSAVRDDSGTHLYDIGQLQDITAQKAAEAAKRESESHLRTIVEQLPAAVYRLEPGANGSFTYTSPRFATLTGLPLDPRDGSLEALFARVHPDDVAALREADALSGRTGQPLDIEYRLRDQDGSWIWVQDRSLATQDEQGALAWHGILLDISEKKRLEAALRDSEARFRALVHNDPDVIAVVDAEWQVVYMSPSSITAFGSPPEAMLGPVGPRLQFIHPEDTESALGLFERVDAQHGATATTEARLWHEERGWSWFQITVSNQLEDPGIGGYVFNLRDVSDRIAAEVALRESEARFRSLFEGAGIGMALSSPEGTILVANPALEHLLGYAPGELEGVRIVDITYPEDLSLQTDRLQRMRDSELDAYEFEKRFVRKDGGIVWGLLNAAAVKDDRGTIQAVIGQVQDITARKAAEAALSESEARFRALVDNDPDVIIVIDDTMTVVYISPSVTAALGIFPDELLGPFEPNLHFVHPADLEGGLALFGEVGGRPGATATAEVRLMHRDLGWRWFQVTVANQLEDPGIGGFLFNLRDITDRKQAALASEAALRTQQAAIAELERLNQSKSRFLSTISHEFRTPLTAIIGYSELLGSRDADPALVAEDAAIIHREASRLNRMVDDILLVDRVDAGHMSMHVTPVDGNTLVHDVAETFRPLTDRHQFVLDLDPSLRPIDGDRDRLSQALTNLVSNAVKYSPAGGRVTIVTRHDGENVVISVRDEGIGVAAADLSRIFDRFERVETGIAGRIAGTGLGLPIVQAIASLHGGRLWAESELGSGSTFHLVVSGVVSQAACTWAGQNS